MKQDFSCRFLKHEWKPMTDEEIGRLKGYLAWKRATLGSMSRAERDRKLVRHKR
jgi:hypothetical protein